MDKNKIKKEKRARRQKKIRSKINGTASVPRLSVFRSNSFMYAQLIDDEQGKTILSATSFKGKVAGKGKKSANKTEGAKEVGKMIAERAIAKKIKKIVFDRSGYVYTGRVKALADGAREGGLIF